MKYPNTKFSRNRAILDYHEAHPELSLQEIGDVFRICKERVRQIILREKKRREETEKATIIL